MNQRNFEKEMEAVIAGIEGGGETPRLLLHACCAPCASVGLARLSEVFAITAYYYNPNITEEAEYQKRAAELVRLAKEMPCRHPVEVVVADYSPAPFLQAVDGMEDLPEGGMRCASCFDLRLGEAIRYAKAHGFSYVTTSLTLSPLKDAALLNAIGERAAKEAGCIWLPSDFKKRDGLRRSIELSTQYGLYRQNYCGCVFSKRRDYAGRKDE